MAAPKASTASAPLNDENLPEERYCEIDPTASVKGSCARRNSVRPATCSSAWVSGLLKNSKTALPASGLDLPISIRALTGGCFDGRLFGGGQHSGGRHAGERGKLPAWQLRRLPTRD